ncbi:cell wall-associated hydrolase (NlpC/P60 family) protein [Salinisphaera sp. C84B14]|uniref:C40 family peptidase n=1 Tax=Salinisphaera sp. C84B14 TaxID=1304155 RepID=UPI003342BB4D
MTIRTRPARALSATLLILIGAVALMLAGCSSSPSKNEIPPTTDTRAAVADAAIEALGRPYQAGATGPQAYDDSGLVYAAYQSVGAALPRDIQAQLDTGKPIELVEAEPADLLFFRIENSQGDDRLLVGLYTQAGEMLMANPGVSGANSGVALFDTDDDFWAQRLVGVVRQLP